MMAYPYATWKTRLTEGEIPFAHLIPEHLGVTTLCGETMTIYRRFTYGDEACAACQEAAWYDAQPSMATPR